MRTWWFVLAGLLDKTPPPTEGNYVEPDWFQPLMQVFDRYGVILLPAAGVFAIAAVAWAILSTATTKTVDPQKRVGIKKAILHELRRQLKGMSGEQIADMVGQNRTAMREMLDEMVKDRMLELGTNDAGKPVYRLRGLGSNSD